jgi:hypothetical protein
VVSPIGPEADITGSEAKMKTDLHWKRFSIGCLLLALLSSCATAAPETPTPGPPTDIPGPTSCEEVEGACLSLTLDGESCTYEGPTELGPGPVALLFSNHGEGMAAGNLLMFVDGKTLEDLIEYNGEEPTPRHYPDWAQRMSTWKGIAPGRIHHWEGELESGDYAMVCTSFTVGTWLGTGLMVR